MVTAIRVSAKAPYLGGLPWFAVLTLPVLFAAGMSLMDTADGLFMTVAYDGNGVWEIRAPKGKPGDYMVMRALMPQIVAISNCPILFNACNNFRLKPLTLEILK